MKRFPIIGPYAMYACRKTKKCRSKSQNCHSKLERKRLRVQCSAKHVLISTRKQHYSFFRYPK